MLLPGVVSLRQLVPLSVHSRPVSSPTPDASVPSQSSLVSSYNFIHVSSFMTDIALFNSFWYIAFQVHSGLTDISFLSDSQMSAVLGENLLK